MMIKIIQRIWCYLFLLFICILNVYAQSGSITAKGLVKDSITGEPLSYVSILFEGTTTGGMTDLDGKFDLKNHQGAKKMILSFLGYNTKEVILEQATNSNLVILISPTSFEIEEVVVKPKKEKYSRKNNPAVNLIRNVIKHKDANRIENKEKYKVESYEKLAIAFDDFNPNLEKGFMKKFGFIKNYIDTSEFNGKPILTVSMRESISDIYYQKNPKKKKTVIRAKRTQGIDKSIDEGGITANLEEIFQPVNLFDNDINILLNRFVSPLSSTLAVSYYKYYILDTLDISGDKCVDLAFAPVNSESYAFTGHLYITLDGSYSVKKLSINTPYNINLNFVEKMRIDQEFMRAPDSTWILNKENTYANFHVVEGTQQLYAHQSRSYHNYDFEVEQADSVFKLIGSIHLAENAEEREEDYWTENRPVALEGKENALSDLLAELKKVPAFNIIIKTLEILITGYVPITEDNSKSKFDFGPMNTTFNANHVEGFRLRAGGMTTANLHDQLFASGYVAFGTNDRKFKYNAKLTYSFDKKKYHEGESPRNNLSFIQEYDVYTPGQDFLFTSKDNMFVALKVGESITKMNYIRKSLLQYEKEWLNGLSIKTWLRQENNEAAGTLEYIHRDDNGKLTRDKSFNTSEIGAQIRFAPGERIYNSRGGKNSVFNMSKDAPVFTLSHKTGFKNVLNSDFAYNHTELSAEKRIWLSSFGHIDAKLKLGKVWDKVSFPQLIMPNTNQSLTIQPEAFHLMNAMEFFADQYVGLSATYYMKGALLNRIPVIKWLKLREVFSFNGFYGSLSDKNNPAAGSNNLYLFPEGTQPIGKDPYMEVSVGLENIFKVLRVDYYRRLTYLNNPNINKHGVRIAMRFSF